MSDVNGARSPLPFGPLADVCAARWRPINRSVTRITMAGQVAQVVGVHRMQSYRWERFGLTIDAADDAANRLGMHPSELWPEWWEVA